MDARRLVCLLASLFWGIAASQAQTPPGVELVPQIGHTAGVAVVAYRPGDPQFLTASTDSTAILWDARTGRQLRTYRGGPLGNSFLTVAELQENGMSPQFPLAAKQTAAVADVDFSRDGRWFVMLCRPKGIWATLDAGSQACIWDVDSGKRTHTFDLPLGAAAVALSPDGSCMLVGGQPLDPSEASEIGRMGISIKPSTGATLWDIATGQMRRQFGDYDATYESVRFSLDGRHVLAAGRTVAVLPTQSPAANPPAKEPNGVLLMWNTDTGEQTLAIRPENGIHRAEFSPSGDTILTVDAASRIEIWDIANGNRRATIPAGLGVFSADGKQVIAMNSAGKISIWDIALGQEVRAFQTGLTGVKDIALSADGARLLVGIAHAIELPITSPKNSTASPTNVGQAVIVNLTTGHVFGSFFARTDPLDFVAVSPTNQYFLIGDGLWDLAQGKKIRNLCDGPLDAFSAAFSPDGGMAVLANLKSNRFPLDMDLKALSAPTADLLATLKTIPDGRETAGLIADFPVQNKAVLQIDGSHILTATDNGRITIWNANDGRPVQVLSINGGRLVTALSPKGPEAAVSFQEMKTLWWNTETGDLAADTGHTKGPPSRLGVPPQSSRDKKLQIAVADDELGIVLQPTDPAEATRTIKTDLASHQVVVAAGFDMRDDHFVYADVSSPCVGLWNIDTGLRLRTFSYSEPFQPELLRFTPDGKCVATAGNEGRISFWDTTTGNRVSNVTLTSPVMSLAFNADASLLAAGCADRTCVILEPSTGRKTVLRGHAGPVDAVAFRPDGKLLITASHEEGTARIWDVATGKELAKILSIGNRTDWLVITPDGRYDGSEGGCKLVAFRVGPGLEVRPPDQFSADFVQPQPGLLHKIWNSAH